MSNNNNKKKFEIEKKNLIKNSSFDQNVISTATTTTTTAIEFRLDFVFVILKILNLFFPILFEFCKSHQVQQNKQQER